MSDAPVPEVLQNIETTTKKGFDLSARLKNRGLRRSSITLYLDEELGPRLGWAHDLVDQFKNIVGRAQVGVIGELDKLERERNDLSDKYEAAVKAASASEASVKIPKPSYKVIDEKIAALEEERDAMIEELTKSGIKIEMRAVPPIIQKDCHRRAKATLGITGKDIPEDRQDEFTTAHTAHLMSLMFQRITEIESGSVNEGTTYEDAIELIGYLPQGQWDRLDAEMGKVQFTDAISRDIESQEDFS